jgi:hypothetical protein
MAQLAFHSKPKLARKNMLCQSLGYAAYLVPCAILRSLGIFKNEPPCLVMLSTCKNETLFL